jgi:hypothetical protein
MGELHWQRPPKPKHKNWSSLQKIVVSAVSTSNLNILANLKYVKTLMGVKQWPRRMGKTSGQNSRETILLFIPSSISTRSVNQMTISDNISYLY